MSGTEIIQTDTEASELETFSHRIGGHNFMVQFPRSTTMLRVYELIKQSVEKIFGEGTVPYREFQIVVERIRSVFEQNGAAPFPRPRAEWEDNLGNSVSSTPYQQHQQHASENSGIVLELRIVDDESKQASDLHDLRDPEAGDEDTIF